MEKKGKKCGCGCGTLVRFAGREFVYGHRANLKSRLCECGCGKKASPGKRFITRHNFRGGNGAFSWQGISRSEATKEKISRSLAGRGHTLQHNANVSKALKGHKSTRKEDKWSINHPYIRQYKYFELLKEIKIRDGDRCIECHRLGRDTRLSAHHIVPIRVGKNSRLCDHCSNLVTLCGSCHLKLEHWNSDNEWKSLLPVVYRYLSQFGYTRLLLRKYYKPSYAERVEVER